MMMMMMVMMMMMMMMTYHNFEGHDDEEDFQLDYRLIHICYIMKWNESALLVKKTDSRDGMVIDNGKRKKKYLYQTQVTQFRISMTLLLWVVKHCGSYALAT